MKTIALTIKIGGFRWESTQNQSIQAAFSEVGDRAISGYQGGYPAEVQLFTVVNSRVLSTWILTCSNEKELEGFIRDCVAAKITLAKRISKDRGSQAAMEANEDFREFKEPFSHDGQDSLEIAFHYGYSDGWNDGYVLALDEAGEARETGQPHPVAPEQWIKAT